MYRCEIREDFEIEWLEKYKKESNKSFHGKYVCGDMISLTLSDLRLLAEGNPLLGM